MVIQTSEQQEEKCYSWADTKHKKSVEVIQVIVVL